jgi:glyoxylate carboligase
MAEVELLACAQSIASTLHFLGRIVGMDNGVSPSRAVKQVDTHIYGVLRNINVRKLSIKERKILNDLQQNLNDSRIYVTDYELSETREEQLKNIKIAKKWLNEAQKNILKASEFNVFDAIDVAHLSAKIEQITADLK